MFWYNGNLIEDKTIELAIDDPGLIYGATVFTTLRVYNNCLESKLTNWHGHCQRLASSIKAFDWQEPDWERLRQGAEILVNTWPVLRIVIFADGREWITGRLLPSNLEQKQQEGVIVWLVDDSQFRRILPDRKTGNYLSAWLALQKAQKMGAAEAILIDEKGNWLETCTGNLWGWQDGHWWTPPVEAGILPGIMRSQLINHFQSHNKEVSQEPWTVNLVKGFEAIVYTNSVVEVIPIQKIITQTLDLPLSQYFTLEKSPEHIGLQQLRQFFTEI